jgi:hypothetical protein
MTGHIRKGRKAEREFYTRDNVQACVICGRLFTKRRDNVCSIACLEKQKEKGNEEHGSDH